QIHDEALGYLRRIEQEGGALSALERGFQQREIAEAAYRWQREVESGERKVVGVNCYRQDDEAEPEVLEIDPRVEADQVARLAAFRAARAEARTRAALAGLESAAREARNLMPPILDAVRAEATLGEIADTLRRVYGEHHETAGG